jgi:hypothetical protein
MIENTEDGRWPKRRCTRCGILKGVAHFQGVAEEVILDSCGKCRGVNTGRISHRCNSTKREEWRAVVRDGIAAQREADGELWREFSRWRGEIRNAKALLASGTGLSPGQIPMNMAQSKLMQNCIRRHIKALGRPPFIPTEDQRKTVMLMAAGGHLQRMIAARFEIDVNTLRKHFRDELDEGRRYVWQLLESGEPTAE